MTALRIHSLHRSARHAGQLLLIAGILFLGACGTLPHGGSNASLSGMGKRLPAYNRPYTIKGRTYYPLSSSAGYHEQGIASWYGWESGSRTSMGTTFDPDSFSAAHRTLPLPSRVRITNLQNGRSIELDVNDRGPFVDGRLIDLSAAAARQLGITGTARVDVLALSSMPTPLPPPVAPAPAVPAPVPPVPAAPISPPPLATPDSLPDSLPLYLQVGAFAYPGNAEGLRQRLLAAGIDNVDIRVDDTGSGSLYRVRIGPYTNAGVLNSTLNDLSSMGITAHPIRH